jgi:hypothetical protein
MHGEGGNLLLISGCTHLSTLGCANSEVEHRLSEAALATPL